jgi:hypothetical protein
MNLNFDKDDLKPIINWAEDQEYSDVDLAVLDMYSTSSNIDGIVCRNVPYYVLYDHAIPFDLEMPLETVYNNINTICRLHSGNVLCKLDINFISKTIKLVEVNFRLNYSDLPIEPPDRDIMLSRIRSIINQHLLVKDITSLILEYQHTLYVNLR